jgi:hypothetical protein
MTTTADTGTAVATVTLKASDLARVLGNTVLACDKSKTLPVLGAVRLEVSGGTITAVATDRHRLHLDTAELSEGSTGETTTLLDRADVATMVKTLKGDKGDVTLTITGSTVALFTRNATLTFDAVEGTFPRYRGLLPEHDDAVTMEGPTHFNPALLADFAKVTDGQRSYERKANTRYPVMRMQMSHPHKPARVEIGDTFVGLIMPVRVDR